MSVSSAIKTIFDANAGLIAAGFTGLVSDEALPGTPLPYAVLMTTGNPRGISTGKSIYSRTKIEIHLYGKDKETCEANFALCVAAFNDDAALSLGSQRSLRMWLVNDYGTKALHNPDVYQWIAYYEVLLQSPNPQ